MIVFICAFIFSFLIVGIGYYKRDSCVDDSTIVNYELEKYYEMFSEQPNTQIRQLVLAAKTLLKNISLVTKDKEIILNLYNERILSDKYFRKVQSAEEDLFLEKAIIENEAESFRAGAKESVFADANRLINSEPQTSPKVKLFDEADFLRRQDILRQRLLKVSEK